MMDNPVSAALGLGFLLGLRHALDGDHLAAMATLLARHRGVAVSCVLGTYWGAGHTLTLLGAGTAVIAFKLAIPPELERGLETVVALVLILLGAHVLLRAVAAIALHRHDHVHDGHAHSHLHFHWNGERHQHLHLWREGRRPFLLGVLHGMAGSAALMLLVLATMPSPLAGLLYIVVFGVGSTLGMLVMSGLVGLPFALAARRSATVHAVVQAMAGAISLSLGLILLWTTGGLGGWAGGPGGGSP